MPGYIPYQVKRKDPTRTQLSCSHTAYVVELIIVEFDKIKKLKIHAEVEKSVHRFITENSLGAGDNCLQSGN